MERPSEHIEIENIVEQERDPMLTHLAEYEKLFLGARSVQQALARTLAERGEEIRDLQKELGDFEFVHPQAIAEARRGLRAGADERDRLENDAEAATSDMVRIAKTGARWEERYSQISGLPDGKFVFAYFLGEKLRPGPAHSIEDFPFAPQ